MNQAEKKQQLREIFKQKRREPYLLSANQAASAKIAQNFFRFFEENREKFENNSTINPPSTSAKSTIKPIIGLYLANHFEVATTRIAKFLEEKHYKIAYPKITNLHSPLEFIVSSPLTTKFIPSSFFKNILEPENGETTKPEILPEILLVPLLAFDKNGFRLGMGGGFYDRSLEKLRQKLQNFLAIGLAFDWQFCEENLQFELCDQRLNAVICESKIFEF